MRTNRFVKWGIVLLLLAALPGMTAVLAQGQEPVTKEPPVVDGASPASVAQWGETPVAYSVWEVENNNTKANAKPIEFGAVVGGDIYGGDVDWYKFTVRGFGVGVLINTDGQMDGQYTDTVVKLFDDSASTEPMSMNDDMGREHGQYDSLLFAVLGPGQYYVQLSNYGGNCSGGCGYELIVSQPVLLSAAAANLGTGDVEGIPFHSEDVLALLMLHDDYANRPQHKWLLFLDGSDVGITKPLVNLGLGWESATGSLTVGFGANQVLTDYLGIARTFTPWDWAQFAFERVGPHTKIYPWSIEYHAGAEHGLTTAGEKIDALDLYWASYPGSDISWYADLYLSTVGAASTPKSPSGRLNSADEDVFYSYTMDGQGYWKSWVHLVVDGSKVDKLAVEDVFAADNERYILDRTYLTILGRGYVMGRIVGQQDIFCLQAGRPTLWCGFWHGPDWGWNYNIDAFDWPSPNGPELGLLTEELSSTR